jgi:predicted RNA binding protein YcfA (HicA-like mRNA interferase family)
MSLPRSTSRKDLIKRLSALGFDGPRNGGKHQFMAKGQLKVRSPNPHESAIGVQLLGQILKAAEITADEWNLLSD